MLQAVVSGMIETGWGRIVRRVGGPEDIAAACAFLASDEATHVTAQIIGVNGGRNT